MGETLTGTHVHDSNSFVVVLVEVVCYQKKGAPSRVRFLNHPHGLSSCRVHGDVLSRLEQVQVAVLETIRVGIVYCRSQHERGDVSVAFFLLCFLSGSFVLSVGSREK